MDELLKERILRRLEDLPDDKAYQVLDYMEFLESKFGSRSGPSTLEKIADRVEDTLRAGRVSVSAIKGTRGVFDAADRVMQGLAAAGKTVVDELQAPVKEAPVKEVTVKEGPAKSAPAKEVKGEKKDGAAAKKTKKKGRKRER